MTIKEAITYYEKAGKESSAANKAYQEAKEAQEAARQKCRNEYKSFFTPEARESYLNSESHRNYEAAQAATAAALKKFNTAAAVHKAAGHNVLNVTSNTLRAAILANPEKFNKPTHFKKFVENVQEVTGNRFYIDNSMSCSLYIYYLDMTHGENNVYICEKKNGEIVINPEKLQERAAEYTLKEIKAEAKKAEKDAEKLRKAAAELEKTVKATRAKYNTYIMYMLPDYSCGSFRDSKLF